MPAILFLSNFEGCGDSSSCSDKPDMIEFQKQLQHLPDLMKAAELRHQVLSQNLANVNTPGYQRLDVSFEEQLASLLQEGRTIQGVKPEIQLDPTSSVRADGNNVDVDKEIGQLGKNAILFQMYTEILNSQYRAMQQAMEMP